MNLFWNRSTESLARLFREGASHSLATLSGRISEVFQKDITDSIHFLGFAANNTGNKLLNEVINELSSLLATQQENWKTWRKADVTRLIPDLVEATAWKMQIRGYKYSVETTGVLAETGLKVMPALSEMLIDFRKDKEPSIRRKLTENHIHTDEEAREVTERALRCVIANLRYLDRTKQTIFEWSKSYKLKLKSSVIKRYLYEQLALYAYMFKDDRNALPIKEIEIGLRRYIENRLITEERTEIAKDIIQDTFYSFFEKKHSFTQKEFYVDKRLTTYFTEMVRNGKKIRKYMKEESRKDHDVTFEDLDLDKEENEYMSAIIRILNQCLGIQDKKCQEIFNKRFFSDYADTLSYEAVAGLLKIPVRTVENRGPVCNGQLRACVIQKSNSQGLRL